MLVGDTLLGNSVKFAAYSFARHTRLLLKASLLGVSYIAIAHVIMIAIMYGVTTLYTDCCVGSYCALSCVNIFMGGGSATAGFSYLMMALIIFVFFVSFIFIGIGIAQIGIDLNDRGESSLRRFYLPQSFAMAAITSLTAYLIIVAGCIFLILPGIFLMTRLWLAQWFAIDQRCTPFESLFRSWRATREVQWEMLLIVLLFIGSIHLGIIYAYLITSVFIPLILTKIYLQVGRNPIRGA